MGTNESKLFIISRWVGAPEFTKELLDIKHALIKLKQQMFVINLTDFCRG